MPLDGYTFTSTDFALLILRKAFPERTDGESAVIRAFLLEHLAEFDSIVFGKRLGRGVTPDPTHLEGVQRQTVDSSKLRLDILAMRGPRPVLVEVKQRVTPQALGQILTYRHHFVEEFPDAPDPELVVVGREAVEDALAPLQAHGVTVYLYPNANASGDVSGRGV